jgi:hypothetical protein
MRHAVEAIGEHKVEQLLCFDLVSIETSPCSVHVEQGIKSKAHSKVDEEIKCHCNVRSSTSGNKDDTACLYCNELYSVSTEIWVGCGHWKIGT